MNNVRTRFAPSPTGYIHVGNVRTALYSWLLAKQKSGKYIMRIEDTDQQRFVEGATELIYETLKWMGLDWDEGPDIGGDYGPYIQSRRKEIYLKSAEKLINKGLAYADPYSSEEVEKFREQAKKYKKPFLYRNYRPKNPPKWDGSQPLRFKVNNPKRYEWHDPIMGDLSAGPEALDDFILIKSDGMATYNFAHIVDDTDMKITHVLRGMEYIASTPKYLSLYDALDIKPPILICMPHIMAPGGNKKLGKRDGAKSVVEYRDQGILPETMINFLATLGWNDGTEQEIFSREELLQKFSFDRVQKSGAQFDEQRLYWMNGCYIRKLEIEDLYNRSVKYWPKAAKSYSHDYKKQVLLLLQDRLKYLSEIANLSYYFFEDIKPDIKIIDGNKQLKNIPKKELKSLLKVSYQSLANNSFGKNELTDSLNNLLVITNEKPAVIFSLIRIATTWAPFSPALADTLHVLGKQESLQRLTKSIDFIS